MKKMNDFVLRQRISLAIKLASPKVIPFLSLAISWGNSDMRQVFTRMYKESLFGDARNIRRYYQYSLHYNCTSHLHNIHLPVLLVYGLKNKSFHKYAHLSHEKLPNSELIFLEKEKHQIPTKAAVKLNEQIDKFISDHG